MSSRPAGLCSHRLGPLAPTPQEKKSHQVKKATVKNNTGPQQTTKAKEDRNNRPRDLIGYCRGKKAPPFRLDTALMKEFVGIFMFLQERKRLPG